MSAEARCPNCGCAFELSPEEVAAIASSAAPPRAEDGSKSSRFAFRPELVEQDGVSVVQIVPVSAPKPRPASER